VKELIRKLEKR